MKQMMCKESYHIMCLFKTNSSGISLWQLSVSSFLKKTYSLKEKSFDKIINQSKFLFTTLNRLCCLED